MWSPSIIRVQISGNPDGESVVVLGGIGPSLNHMGLIRQRLGEAGYRVINIEYPSTYYSIRELADEHVGPAIAEANIHLDRPLHFVTMSMGGIVARACLRDAQPVNLGRVAMVAPPNHGSEVADWLKDFFLFKWRFGPAGQELTTEVDATPCALGAANFEAGVIAGTRSLDPWFAWLFKGKHDGKVSVESAKLDGMKDFAIVQSDHYLITRHEETLVHTLTFLKEGRFANFNPHSAS
ncbi:MAG: esterase/lipase family protein [Puniceicoccales bacterium]